MTANQASLARTGLPAPQATSAVSISPILGKGDIVTGVRGTTDGDVIVAGLETADTIPSGIEVTVWRLPVPQYSAFVVDGEVDWNRVEAYVVIKCDAVRQKQAKR